MAVSAPMLENPFCKRRPGDALRRETPLCRRLSRMGDMFVTNSIPARHIKSAGSVRLRHSHSGA